MTLAVVFPLEELPCPAFFSSGKLAVVVHWVNSYFLSLSITPSTTSTLLAVVFSREQIMKGLMKRFKSEKLTSRLLDDLT